MVGYQRDTLDDRVDGRRALHGVGLVLQEQFGLKLDEVCLVVVYVLTQLVGRVLPGETVWIVAVGQQQYLEVHSLRQKHVGAFQGSMQTSRVVVVDEGDIGCEPVEHVYLREAERGT